MVIHIPEADRTKLNWNKNGSTMLSKDCENNVRNQNQNQKW